LKKRIIVIIFMTLLISVGIFVYTTQREVKNRELYYSGTIEATTAELSFQVSGRVDSIPADEGHHVKKGDVLAQLDKSPYLSRYHEAAAHLDQAGKNVDRLETLRGVLEKTLPAEVGRARAAVASANAVRAEARNNRERYETLYKRNVVSRQEWEAVELKYATARAGHMETLAVLRQAESNLKNIEAIQKEIEVAKAEIAAARAALDYAELHLSYTELTAPFEGIVTSRNVELGEVITPGREVLTLADLSEVELKIYVDETEIGKVKPGRKAAVTIDTFRSYLLKGNSPPKLFKPGRRE
jgi:HlyD family secretion protein